MTHHNDFEKEPIPGLPAHLPEGEHIVWQGKPDLGEFMRSAAHSHKIATYFGLLAVWRLSTGLYDARPLIDVVSSIVWTIGLGAVVVGLCWLFAKLAQRTTIYTITNKRVVMRFGIALPVTFNLPYSQVTSADVKRLGNDTGTIALTLKEHTKISWPILWPHVRAWKLARPQPCLRAIADIDDVATKLATQLQAAHGKMGQSVKIEPAETSGHANAAGFKGMQPEGA